MGPTQWRDRKSHISKFRLDVYSIRVDLGSYSIFHIDVSIHSDSNDESWRFTRFYGNLDAVKMDESWRLLKLLSKNSLLQGMLG